jgi:hypothetical protein
MAEIDRIFADAIHDLIRRYEQQGRLGDTKSFQLAVIYLAREHAKCASKTTDKDLQKPVSHSWPFKVRAVPQGAKCLLPDGNAIVIRPSDETN